MWKFYSFANQDHFSFQILYHTTKMDPLDTPLHKAVRAGNIQDVKALILNGAEIDAKNKHDETPLFQAAKSNLVSIAKIYL